MASSSRKKTTMAKLNREAAVRERRQRKQMRKDARKNAPPEDANLETDPFADREGNGDGDGAELGGPTLVAVEEKP